MISPKDRDTIAGHLLNAERIIETVRAALVHDDGTVTHSKSVVETLGKAERHLMNAKVVADNVKRERMREPQH